MPRRRVEHDKRLLSVEVREDRLERYLSGEPLRLIAADHGVDLNTIIRTVRTYAPWALGRPRGGGRRDWSPS